MTEPLVYIKGHCPACGRKGCLYVGEDGYITCSWHICREPDALTSVLEDPYLHRHQVWFGERDFAIQHPLIERLGDLRECGLHQHILLLDGPPVKPGCYLADHDGERWRWTEYAQ